MGLTGNGSPLKTAQNPQLRVQTFPKIINVAVGFEKHSKILGHLADSQTVCKFLFLNSRFTSWLLRFLKLFLSQGGNRLLLD
jgi:hypothetical protein